MSGSKVVGAAAFLAMLVVTLGGGAAHAHEAVGGGGFLTGLAHPVAGWEHVIAMVAVGLWGAFLRAPAIWLLPVVFPLVMSVGASAGVVGLPLPAVEAAIAASAVAMGLLIASGARLPLWTAALVVGVFAVFHGHAHGSAMPQAADPLGYAVGFVLATGLLHLCGIALGLLARWPAGRVAVRAGGGAISAFGLATLLGLA